MPDNPIIKEFIKLNLINKKNFEFLCYTSRTKKVKVYRDKKTNVYFLAKYLTDKNYYLKDRDFTTKELKKYQLVLRKDEKRRIDQFKFFYKGKKIIDYGCEYGGFLKLINKVKKKYGVELNLNCRRYIKKNLSNVEVFQKLDQIKEKVDLITSFHVLEHLPHQVESLKKIKEKLKYGGKIILEVPSANDFLLSLNEVTSFKKFIFWHEHLVLHTIKSLKKILSVAGFKKIKIIEFQRYNLNNHLGWIIKGKPGGHIFFKKMFNKLSNKKYKDLLVKNHKTDTLIAIASK